MLDIYFEPSFGNRPHSLVGGDSVINEFEAALNSRPGSRKGANLNFGNDNPFEPMSKNQILDELAESRQQAREGNYRDFDEALDARNTKKRLATIAPTLALCTDEELASLGYRTIHFAK